MKSLHNKSFKTMLDYTPEEIKYYLDLAAKLKEKISYSSLKRILREHGVPLK